MSQETQTQETQEPNVPVFDEVNQITQEGAVNILIQAAMAAQNAGRLNVRDSVLLAKAIEIVRPGTI